MNIPEIFILNSHKWLEIKKLIETLPNDMDLGKAIRTYYNQNEDSPKKIWLDKPPFTEDYVQ